MNCRCFLYIKGILLSDASNLAGKSLVFLVPRWDGRSWLPRSFHLRLIPNTRAVLPGTIICVSDTGTWNAERTPTMKQAGRLLYEE
jgi:hypothetical protein